MAREPYSPVPGVEPTGPSGANLQIQANPTEFGALPAQGLERMGVGSEEAGSRLMQSAIYAQGLRNEADARGASNAFMQDAGKAWAQYGTLQGKDASDAYPKFSQQLAQLQQQHADALGSPQAKNDFLNASSYMLNRLTLMGSTHAAQQEREYWKQSHLGNIETAGQWGVLMQNDPHSVDTAANSIADSVRQVVKMNGGSDDAAAAQTQQALGRYFREVIRSQAAQNPAVAMSTFDRVRGRMDGASIAATDSELKGFMKSSQVDAIASHFGGGGTAEGFGFNAGNIRASGTPFEGKGAPRSGFETFHTPEQGVKALVDNLYNYAQRSGGQITLANAISRWAPPTENNTDAYIQSVANETGIAPNQPVPLGDVHAMASLAKAMNRIEKGGVKYPEDAFQRGAAASVAEHTDPAAYVQGYQQINAAVEYAAKTHPGDPVFVESVRQKTTQEVSQQLALSRQFDAAADKQRKDALTAAEDDYIPKIITDPTSVDVRAIANDPRLASNPERRNTLVRMLNESLQNNPKTAAVSHQTATNLLSDMRRPADDPQRMTDLTPAYDAYTQGHLTNSDFNFVQQQFKESQSPGGERLDKGIDQFLKAVKPSIDKSNPLMGVNDPDGAMQYYRLQQNIQQKVAQYRKDGKDPHDLLDPSKPDFLGKPEALAPYQTSMEQSIGRIAGQLQQNAAPVPTAPAATEGKPLTSSQAVQQLPMAKTEGAPKPPPNRPSLDQIFGTAPPSAMPQ